ncbi:hypothetical protein BKA83DRAFT_681149 [Pisolithus microcarpus]|nr:hypothetical protein BKA83DRAFT_681149 [Pisolithus microcarpus]
MWNLANEIASCEGAEIPDRLFMTPTAPDLFHFVLAVICTASFYHKRGHKQAAWPQ